MIGRVSAYWTIEFSAIALGLVSRVVNTNMSEEASILDELLPIIASALEFTSVSTSTIIAKQGSDQQRHSSIISFWLAKMKKNMIPKVAKHRSGVTLYQS